MWGTSVVLHWFSSGRGEEITITRHGKPVARIVPAAELPPRKPGRRKGLVQFDPDVFFEPPTGQDLKDWEGDLDEVLAMPMPEAKSEAPKRGGRKRTA